MSNHHTPTHDIPETFIYRFLYQIIENIDLDNHRITILCQFCVFSAVRAEPSALSLVWLSRLAA